MNDDEATFFEPVEYPKYIRVPVSASRCSAAKETGFAPSAAPQDGNNAMVIAAVQQACNDIVQLYDEFMDQVGWGEKMRDWTRTSLKEVMQIVQRRLVDSNDNNAG